MRKSTFLGMVLLLSSTISVFAQPVRTVSKALSSSTNQGVLTIQTQEAWVSVDVVQASTVHVRITEQKPETDFSYSVLSYTPSTQYVLAEDPTEWNIYTPAMHVVISKDPVRITVKNEKGKVLFQNEPSLGTMWNGSECTTYNTLFPDERFIGLGEKTGNLDRRGNGYTNWNTDAYGYTPDTDPLYASIPFYIGLHDSLCYGVFLDNTSKSHFNFGASNTRFSSFSVEDGEMDYYVFAAPSIAGIIEQYTALTGRMPMPAQWSLGFQQCRWSYYPENEVLQLAQTFRDKEIPLDVLYLDIHYMDAYKVFTWDKNKFPRPAEMISSLRKKEFAPH
jgi:alpha-glucosidase